MIYLSASILPTEYRFIARFRFRVGFSFRWSETLLRTRHQQLIARDQSRVRIEFQPESWLVQVGDIEAPFGRNRLVHEKVAKHRQDRFAVRGIGQVFLEWCVGLRDDEVIAIRSAGVRHNGDIVRGSHGGDALELGHAAHPHDVGLEDIEVATLDEFAEAEARVLVFAGGELDGRMGAFELLEAVAVVGRQALFPPIDVEVFASFDQLDGVRDIQAHVAVDAQWEVRSDAFAVLSEEIHVAAQA